MKREEAVMREFSQRKPLEEISCLISSKMLLKKYRKLSQKL